MSRFLIFLLLPFLLLACSTSKKQISGAAVDAQFDSHFCGYILMDPETGEVLQELHSDRYFTPASNIKLLTVFTAMNLLPEQCTAFECFIRQDQTFIRPQAYPLFPFAGNATDLPTLLQLKALPGDTLYLILDQMGSPAYGPGWAWDDALFAFQTERSPMSLYRNTVSLNRQNILQPIRAYPGQFEVETRPDIRQALLIPETQQLFLPSSFDTMPSVSTGIPFPADAPLFASLLENRLERPVRAAGTLPQDAALFQTIPAASPIDSLYKYILQNSDNHLAEQLLLHCSSYYFDTLSVERMIEYASEEVLSFLSHPPTWVDGSGLSRYNLATPRSLAELLTRWYQTQSFDRLSHLLPAGGQSGTIRKSYAGNPPFVFAKTGTLRNNHCLSGYIRTRSGKVLVFSFMHNNFIHGPQVLKDQMETILKAIYETY